MRIIYFSKNYTPHDYRFLSSLSKTDHEVFYLQLEANKRQTEDRPVPENIQQILWAGGQREFGWRDVPRLTFDLRRLTKELKPDLIHAGLNDRSISSFADVWYAFNNLCHDFLL